MNRMKLLGLYFTKPHSHVWKYFSSFQSIINVDPQTQPQFLGRWAWDYLLTANSLINYINESCFCQGS